MEKKEQGTLIAVSILVEVHPERMRPYPTIATLPPAKYAAQLILNHCTADLRWAKGVERLIEATATVVPPQSALAKSVRRREQARLRRAQPPAKKKGR